MEKKMNVKQAVYQSIQTLLNRSKQEYATLNEIYREVASYLEIPESEALRSQIRGRLQENCSQYSSFRGEDLFETEKIRSGRWRIRQEQTKFIRHSHNTFLVTDDNWRTTKKAQRLSSKYVSEENQDEVYKVKLIDLIGIEKASIILQELEHIRLLLQERN